MYQKNGITTRIYGQSISMLYCNGYAQEYTFLQQIRKIEFYAKIKAIAKTRDLVVPNLLV
jgi:hypothetical protein